jgi:hypothetical protein
MARPSAAPVRSDRSTSVSAARWPSLPALVRLQLVSQFSAAMCNDHDIRLAAPCWRRIATGDKPRIAIGQDSRADGLSTSSVERESPKSTEPRQSFIGGLISTFDSELLPGNIRNKKLRSRLRDLGLQMVRSPPSSSIFGRMTRDKASICNHPSCHPSPKNRQPRLWTVFANTCFIGRVAPLPMPCCISL